MAFSGGPDSACLLHMLTNSSIDRGLTVVHVDHGLDRGSARRAERAVSIAEAMGLRCILERVQVRRSGSIEANARHARYEVLRKYVGPGNVLVTAHHADDVAETMLLRLLRGSGPGGLGGIPQRRRFGDGYLIRPLLAFRREQIQGYLERHRVSSIHDPANDLVSLDRNFLRHEVLPLLREHFPGCVQAFARSASLNRSASDVLADMARADFSRAARPGPSLSLAALADLTDFRLAEAVRHWCMAHDQSPPPGHRLDEFLRQLRQARPDRQPVLDWDQRRLQRHGQSLWLRERRQTLNAWQLDWDGREKLILPEPVGALCFASPIGGLKFTVCSGRPGDKLSLHPTQGRRQVKKLLAEAGVPPWLRTLWPRVWADGRVVAVGDRWMDGEFAALLRAHGSSLRWESELSEHVHPPAPLTS